VALGDRTNPNRFAARIGSLGRPPVQRYPSWMDPAYQLSACAGQYSDVITLDASGVFVVEGNPRRWALGFAALFGIVTTLDVTPVFGPGVYSLGRLDPATPLWYTLSDMGPLVCAQWRVVGTAGAQFVYLWCEVR
jgi:hypothetical protein